MWVGNIPAGMKKAELERVFNTCPVGGVPDADADDQVLSIYMLDYTRCCFVSFRTEYAMKAAISRLHDVSLRPDDPSVPPLVCRVRTQGDELNAGVNSQRGKGMHLKWIRDKRKKLDVSNVRYNVKHP
jgi:hypothetical protein